MAMGRGHSHRFWQGRSLLSGFWPKRRLRCAVGFGVRPGRVAVQDDVGDT